MDVTKVPQHIRVQQGRYVSRCPKPKKINWYENLQIGSGDM